MSKNTGLTKRTPPDLTVKQWNFRTIRRYFSTLRRTGFVGIAADASGLGRGLVAAVLEAGAWADSQGFAAVEPWKHSAKFAATHARTRARWAVDRLDALNDVGGSRGTAGKASAITWQLERAMPEDFGERPPTNEGAMSLVLVLRSAGEAAAIRATQDGHTQTVETHGLISGPVPVGVGVEPPP
jgi:hypothetical protein